MRRPVTQRKWLALAAALLAAGLPAVWASSETPGDFIKFSTVKWERGQSRAQTQSGETVQLGLVERYQHLLQDVLVQAKPIAAAATMIDATSGQILAAAELGRDARGSLLFEPVAPAASLFKLVTTVALYERSDVTPSTQVCTHGGLRGIEREHLAPAQGPGTVCTKFAQALGVSRNAVFAQLATQRLMRSDLEAVAASFGFGRQVQLDAPAHLGTLDIPYNDLEFARTAAGFQNSRLSVMGAAQIVLSIARGGELTPMHFGPASPNQKPTRIMS